MVAAFSAVDGAGRTTCESELVALFDRHNVATDGTMATDVTFLQVVATRS